MSGHTPGPWRVEEGERLIWGNCQDDAPRISGGYPVAEARTKWQSGNWAKRPDADEAQANARLVAAAPTMFSYVQERAEEGDPKAIAIMEKINAS